MNRYWFDLLSGSAPKVTASGGSRNFRTKDNKKSRKQRGKFDTKKHKRH